MSQLSKYLQESLKKLYFIENSLIDEFPLILQKVKSDDLKQAMQLHYEEIGDHVRRLEDIFVELGLPLEEMESPSFRELLLEGSEALQKFDENPDLLIICAAIKVEHTKMGHYVSFLHALKEQKNKKLHTKLQMSLEEELNVSKKLESLLS